MTKSIHSPGSESSPKLICLEGGGKHNGVTFQLPVVDIYGTHAAPTRQFEVQEGHRLLKGAISRAILPIRRRCGAIGTLQINAPVFGFWLVSWRRRRPSRAIRYHNAACIFDERTPGTQPHDANGLCACARVGVRLGSRSPSSRRCRASRDSTTARAARRTPVRRPRAGLHHL